MTSDALTFEQRFWMEAARWSYETAIYSSTSQMTAHPSAQAIIGMGHAAVPYLLRAMTVIPDQWFVLIAVITGEKPNPAWWSPGKVDEIDRAWLRWAKEKGIQPAPEPPFEPGRINTLLDVLRLTRGDQCPTTYEGPAEDPFA